jgi:carbamate kinase
MGRIAVLAMGGNALTQVGQTGTYEEQAANATLMARSVASLVHTGWEVVVVHGNGPQVGNLSIQQEEGSDLVPPQPLFALGAMTQGHIGSLLTLALRRVRAAAQAGVVSLVTHALVDPEDPAFADPTKPIGPFLAPEEAEAFAASRGWVVKDDAGRGHRRVVASPQPTGIVEVDAIRALLHEGFLVVAGGGGGIPVVSDGSGYRGVDAVIDKDYAAQCLASSLRADALVLVTSVESVLLDYGTPRQRAIAEISLAEAEGYLAEGQFAEGSMGPKMRAAIRFLQSGGEAAVITTPALVYASLEGTVSQLEGPAGTRIVRMHAEEGAGR